MLQRGNSWGSNPGAILKLRGDDVRKNFEKIKNGIRSSIDFLKKELHVQSLNSMPYPAMLVPLAGFFATNKVSGKPYTDHQRKELIKWFWQSNFSRRYSSSVDSRHRHNITELGKLRDNPGYKIQNINAKIEPSFFTENQFSTTSVNSNILILMLAQSKPKSFISGGNVDLEKVLKQVNRNEFHHIFPKKHLEKQGVPKAEINQFANFCFLSNSDNQKIKDKPPHRYKNFINSDALKTVMEHALCPEDSLDLDFSDFIKKRVEILREKAEELII